jgi:hypothetical protein
MVRIGKVTLMTGQKVDKGKWWWFWGFKKNGKLMQLGPKFKTKSRAIKLAKKQNWTKLR